MTQTTTTTKVAPTTSAAKKKKANNFWPSEKLVGLMKQGEQQHDTYLPLIRDLRDLCIEDFGDPRLSDKVITKADRSTAARIINAMEAALDYCRPGTTVNNAALLDVFINIDLNYETFPGHNHCGLDMLHTLFSMATFWEYHFCECWPNPQRVADYALLHVWFVKFHDMFLKEAGETSKV